MPNYMINLKITICVSELGYLGEGIAHCERYMVHLSCALYTTYLPIVMSSTRYSS